jgi:hypothetical protein
MGIDVNAIAKMVFGKALGYVTPELGIVFIVYIWLFDASF